MNEIMSLSSHPMSSYNNLNDFLKHHQAVKGGGKPTHTRIGNTKLQIYGGSYDILKDKLQTFFQLYYKTVFLDKKMEYLTERQLEKGGGILVDIDFRYNHDVCDRQHTKEHIQDMVVLYLDELKPLLNFTEDKSFPVYIFEKPQVNRLEDGSLTKDGIHMIIGVQLEHQAQLILRDKVIAKIGEIWTDIPIINKWENVFDDGISKGTTNWQMFGSRKPGNLAYELTQYYLANLDATDNEFMIKEQSTKDLLSSAENLYKLSAQYGEHPSFEYTESFQKVLAEKTNAVKKSSMKRSKIQSLHTTEEDSDMVENIPLEEITNESILQKAMNNILKSLSIEEYHVREAHEYTQILPCRFYEPGSHLVNTNVALALKHTDNRLFLSWVILRSKAQDFSYDTIPYLYERWSKFKGRVEGGLTIRSIMYWAKEAPKEEYARVRNNTCDHYIEQTISNPNDFDFAKVLYHMYKDRYLCSDITNKTWYLFKNHRWEIDRGQTLRMMISTEMWSIYKNKLDTLEAEMMQLESTDPKQVALKKKISKINDVATMLKKTSEKNNIMTEARELFFDAEFNKKVDSNRWLICFKNGVVDIENKVFRNGLPTDYITKSTNINYEEYDNTNEEQQKIACEINTFMKQLFPEKEDGLCSYMWNHLSSVLIGENTNQIFNIYHGKGSNGKSMLTDLMFMTLGEYAGTVPITLITEKRPKIGGTSSEIMQLKGIRYAVMAEPKKGERLNEGIMKQLTGDSTISGRALYSETETFTIQFHLVVCTNTLFEMTSHDDGTWRRIRICEFKSKFVEPEERNKFEELEKKTKLYPYIYEKNKYLKDKMKKWVSVFAGMLVQLAFKTKGTYSICNTVEKSTSEYRKGSDYISSFVEEKIIEVSTENTSSVLKLQEVTQEFKLWFSLEAPSERMPKQSEIREFITNKFHKQSKKLGGWVGLQINYNNAHTSGNDNEDSQNSVDDVEELE